MKQGLTRKGGVIRPYIYEKMSHMTKRTIHLPEALLLLADGQLDDTYSVEFSASDRVEATDAIKLGAMGIDVPEACIYYDDANIADDENFDGEWVSIESDVAHYKRNLYIERKFKAQRDEDTDG
jgi:hypothetical protein